MGSSPGKDKSHLTTVSTTLPPEVRGGLRGRLTVNVSKIVWRGAAPCRRCKVRLAWWGEETSCTWFEPVDVKSLHLPENWNPKNIASYGICCGLPQFEAYLRDMRKIDLDVVDAVKGNTIGFASVENAKRIKREKNMSGFFPVFDHSGKKIAELQVAFELDAFELEEDKGKEVEGGGRLVAKSKSPKSVKTSSPKKSSLRANQASSASPKQKSQRISSASPVRRTSSPINESSQSGPKHSSPKTNVDSRSSTKSDKVTKKRTANSAETRSSPTTGAGSGRPKLVGRRSLDHSSSPAKVSVSSKEVSKKNILRDVNGRIEKDANEKKNNGSGNEILETLLARGSSLREALTKLSSEIDVDQGKKSSRRFQDDGDDSNVYDVPPRWLLEDDDSADSSLLEDDVLLEQIFYSSNSKEKAASVDKHIETVRLDESFVIDSPAKKKVSSPLPKAKEPHERNRLDVVEEAMPKETLPIGENNIDDSGKGMFLFMYIQNAIEVEYTPPLGNQAGEAKPNLYVICRTPLTGGDDFRSQVVWNSYCPKFGFEQFIPIPTNEISIFKDNFLVIEVWDKRNLSGDVRAVGDILIGIVKVPLHQFFVSFRDPRVQEVLLGDANPIVASNDYEYIVNPIDGMKKGSLNVYCAMGSLEQIHRIRRSELFTFNSDQLNRSIQTSPRKELNTSILSAAGSLGDHNNSSFRQQGTSALEKSILQEIKGQRQIVYIVIEQAKHLPLVYNPVKDKVPPNVYVSYQVEESENVICTDVAMNTCDPKWNHRYKAELASPLDSSSSAHPFRNKNIIFKVWHKDSEVERLLGFVNVDFYPLLSGMNELCGWYHIVDLKDITYGELKIRIIPANNSLSFEDNSFIASSSIHLDQMYSHHGLSHERELQNHHHPSGSPGSICAKVNLTNESIDEFNWSFPAAAVQQVDEDANESVSMSLTDSFLAGHLKRNLEDLDVIQKKFQAMLMNNASYTHTDKPESPGKIPTFSISTFPSDAKPPAADNSRGLKRPSDAAPSNIDWSSPRQVNTILHTEPSFVEGALSDTVGSTSPIKSMKEVHSVTDKSLLSLSGSSEFENTSDNEDGNEPMRIEEKSFTASNVTTDVEDNADESGSFDNLNRKGPDDNSNSYYSPPKCSPALKNRSPSSRFSDKRRSPGRSSSNNRVGSSSRSPKRDEKKSPRLRSEREGRNSPRLSPERSGRNSPRLSTGGDGRRSPRFSPGKGSKNSPRLSPGRDGRSSPLVSPGRDGRNSPHGSPAMEGRSSPHLSPERRGENSRPISPGRGGRSSPLYSQGKKKYPVLSNTRMHDSESSRPQTKHSPMSQNRSKSPLNVSSSPRKHSEEEPPSSSIMTGASPPAGGFHTWEKEKDENLYSTRFGSSNTPLAEADTPTYSTMTTTTPAYSDFFMTRSQIQESFQALKSDGKNAVVKDASRPHQSNYLMRSSIHASSSSPSSSKKKGKSPSRRLKQEMEFTSELSEEESRRIEKIFQSQF
eukprot:Nk52_evm1s318 gene=Nk52_evmTU1s318